MAADADCPRCIEPDCERPAAPRRERCWGHIKQLVRHGRTWPLRPRLEPRQRLFEAALDLGLELGDEEWDQAERRFWDAFRAAARTATVSECLALSPGGKAGAER